MCFGLGGGVFYCSALTLKWEIPKFKQPWKPHPPGTKALSSNPKGYMINQRWMDKLEMKGYAVKEKLVCHYLFEKLSTLGLQNLCFLYLRTYLENESWVTKENLSSRNFSFYSEQSEASMSQFPIYIYIEACSAMKLAYENLI